ncbi:thioesterase family protein [Staphylococcus americanisciuri]|uniref:Thioesterase family protein n=1 Tax=Staphylococcus americanisciuri TaxID=2973940 RepID=A0ABT2F2M5_9STAP|nr:thioesterase family protein [Staphylococcus americanisciuri]MCS4486087.1 thioesterase family protein [Staphylococcus americanisciuri]
MLSYPFSDHTIVDNAWIDRNGHMNDAAYARVFSLAIDHFHDQIGLTTAEREVRNYTVFTLETHITYLQEIERGHTISIKVRIYDYDAKRTHFFMELFDTKTNTLCATGETMMMGIDRNTRRSAPYPDDIYRQLAHYFTSQGQQQWPEQLGHRMSIPQK